MMPMLKFEPRGSCGLCDCRLHGFMIGTYRINKGSLKSPRGGLSFTECPECGNPAARRNPMGVSPASDHWILMPESQAIVDETRARKGWA